MMLQTGGKIARIPLAYLLLTLVLTWPLAARLATELPGTGDALQQTWILAWNAHALATDPLNVWQAPIFYPYPTTAAYHDHHLIQMLLAGPVIWLTDNPVLAHNLLILLSFVLTGWAVYQLARDMCGQPWAAFVAGAAFTFCAYRMSHILQLNLLQTAWLPWALLFLRRLLLGGHWRDGLWFGLFAGLQCANALYYAFFSAALLGGYTGLWLLATLWRRLRHAAPLPWPTAGGLLLGGAVATLITVPFLLPYLELYRTLGIVRSLRELENWSAPLNSYTAALPQNWLYSRLGETFVGSGEFVLFPGLLVGLLALAGLAGWPTRTRTAPTHRPFQATPLDLLFWLLVAAAAFVLSLGTGLRLTRGGGVLPLPLPYLTLYNLVPGFGAMRVPARWGMLVALALALLAALGLARLLARLAGRRKTSVAALVLALVLLETTNLPVPLSGPVLREVPPVYAWLGQPEQREVQVVLELPLPRVPRGEALDRITWRHFYSMAHWKKLPVAYGALLPFGTTELLAKAQTFPAAETLNYLQLTGVDTIVIHRNEYDPAAWQALQKQLAASPMLRLQAEVGESSVYTLLPNDNLAAFARESRPGDAVYISADERMPGILSLGLVRRWREAGLQLYGPGRIRFYGPLAAVQPGQVFRYGLLSDSEDPARLGFSPAGLRWKNNGLAFYAADPNLRASLNLAEPVVGQFHPRYPARLDLSLEPTSMRLGNTSISWAAPLTQPWLELDIASLGQQTLLVHDQPHQLTAGASTLAVPLPPGGAISIAADGSGVALLHMRLREGQPPRLAAETGLVAHAEASFNGSMFELAVQAGGSGELLLDVRGAAARDDRPIALLSGTQAVPAGGQLRFAVDLLKPEAPWLAASSPPEDGRYIVYLKDAGRPGSPGQPVAQFHIRNGQLADPQPVPLPLTIIR
ncbi:MAG: glycosyltransferase family 39 protein [Chloroflexaceae bacterium]|jgi:hypothetical protein|nr:glycosyltransferase family 39 protein [Chloroflexaceae bacterium]